MRRVHSLGGRPLALTVALGLCAVVLLQFGVAVGGASPIAPAPPHLLSQPYTSFSSGRVNVVFPSSLPYVQLSAVDNVSVAAGLSVDQILEIANSASNPRVVAVAFPSDLSSFNGSNPAGSNGLPFSLTANLSAYPADAPLWAGPGAAVAPSGAPLGVAHLQISYSLNASSSPSSGVQLTWVVTDWPWLSASDLLGIQLGMTTQSGTGVVACTVPGLTVAPSGCSGTAVASGGSLWAASVAGLQGDSAGGPTASISWSPDLTTAAGESAAVIAGVLVQSPSLGHLLLAAPAQGSTYVSGSIAFSLFTPLAPTPIPLVLHGEWGWFGGSLALAAVGGLAGTVWYRRRARSLERDL